MLRPGDEIDSWCGTCKMVLAHTIEALVGVKPARVHCNTCKSQHAYKASKPGESSRTPRPRGTVRASQYQKLIGEKDISQARRYSPKEIYAAGDLVEHPSFGMGVTTAIKDGTKIEVLFEGGTKMLIHGR